MRWRCGGNAHSSLSRHSREGVNPRKQRMRCLWIPAFAGMTILLGAAAPAHAEDKIRFSYVVPTIDYTPLLVAIDKGYFAEEGIAVDLVQAQGGIATPALISGDLDFSGSSSAAISAVLKGAHLKVLTTGEDRSAYELWARPDITSLDDLKGQQVGVISRGDTTEISLR